MKKHLFWALPLLLVNMQVRAAEVCSPLPGDFDWPELQAKIEAGEAKTVEQLLCLLPENYRKSYVLAKDSRSLQRSNPLNPRAILFHPQDPTKIIMSFAGEPGYRGYNNFEIIRRTDRAGGIEFYDIAFDPNGEALPKITHNPEKCMNCHGTRISPADRRYLFDANPAWPGFYGSGLPTTINADKRAKENEEFALFKEHAKTHSRYKYLLDLENKVPNRIDMRAKPGSFPMENMNVRFTVALASHNRQRLLRIVQSTPYYQNYKYALYAALVCEEPIEEFVPESLRSWHRNESWIADELKGLDLAAISDEQKELILKRLDKANKELRIPEFILVRIFNQLRNYPHTSASAKFALDSLIKQEDFGGMPFITSSWRYLFEGRKNPVVMAEWNIDVNLASYRFNNNPEMNMDLTEFIPLLKADADLAEAPSGPGSDCGPLKAKSLQSLASVAAEVSVDEPMTQEEKERNLLDGRAVVNFNCAHCHARPNQDFAPKFDFHNKAMVTGLSRRICSALNKPLEARGHMPKFFRFEKSQMETLFSYFQSLNPRFACEATDGYEIAR